MNSSIEIVQVDPRSVRDRVVDLLWEQRHWPAESREEYLRLWDWRYSALSEGEPLSWVARAPDGEIVGHQAVFPRRFRLGERELRCALPGDALVHPAWRSSGIGARLVLMPRQLLREHDFDLVLVVGNSLVHRLCVRLGYQDLGTYQRYADLRRTGPWLRRRFGRAVASLGPAADLLWAARRRLRQQRGRRRAGGLVVERLDAEAVMRLDTGHWRHAPDRVVAAESAEYVVRRFLDDPFTRREMFGLFDSSSGRLEGHVIVEFHDASASVCDCRVNDSRVDAATAIGIVGDQLPATTETYAVPTRPGSALAAELETNGFVARSSASPEEGQLYLTAFWSPKHPAAAELGHVERWNLYTGAADA